MPYNNAYKPYSLWVEMQCTVIIIAIFSAGQLKELLSTLCEKKISWYAQEKSLHLSWRINARVNACCGTISPASTALTVQGKHFKEKNEQWGGVWRCATEANANAASHVPITQCCYSIDRGQRADVSAFAPLCITAPHIPSYFMRTMRRCKDASLPLV